MNNNGKKFEVAIQMKAKNGVLHHFIDEKGWTQSDFARAIGMGATIVGSWFNLKDFPRTEKTMKRVVDMIGMLPEDIFPEFIRDEKFLKTAKCMTVYKEMDVLSIQDVSPKMIAFDMNPGFEMKDMVQKALATLTSREEEALKMRYGIDPYGEHTLEEIGEKMRITRERVRQLILKGTSKLKHDPSRRRILIS